MVCFLHFPSCMKCICKKKKKKKAWLQRHKPLLRESEACRPLETASFGFQILRFSFPTGVQKVIPNTLELEMADPQNNAVRQEGSWAAGRPAPGLTLVNDSLPCASTKDYNSYFFSSNYYLVRSLIQGLLDTEECFLLGWDLDLFVLLLRSAY